MLDHKPLFDVGEGEPIILLNGLIGNLSNWGRVAYEFTSSHRILIPRLPFYQIPVSSSRLNDLVIYLDEFVEAHSLNKMILIGNSLGGHIALLYAWRYPSKVARGILFFDLKFYLVIQIVVVISVLFVLALLYNVVETSEKVLGSLFIVITLINCGAMLEQRRWIYYLEYIRLFLITGYMCFWMGSVHAFFLSTILIIIFGASNRPRKFYLKFIYNI